MSRESVKMQTQVSVEATRQSIKSPTFNTSNFIGMQLQSIPLEEEIEEEVGNLQYSAMNMEAELLEEIDIQLAKLKEVDEAVDHVKYNFQHASEGAIRIGGKLASTERERQQISKSIELLAYVKAFQDLLPETIDRITSVDIIRLRSLLPMDLGKKNWSELAKILHDLHKITLDLNKEDVQEAQLAIVNVTQVVETELLGQFDNALEALMRQPNNYELLTKAKAIAEILQLFSNGQTVQKRYIFTVIQKRIPNDAFFSGNKDNENNKGSILKQMQQAIQTIQKSDPTQLLTSFDNDRDDDSSMGASDDHSDDDEDTINRSYAGRLSPIDDKASPNMLANLKSLAMEGMGANNLTNQQVNKSFQLLDHLSGLFSMINAVCLEQFELIRQIFPAHTIARVTRLLLQRIFNDPAFGIQAKVDEILCPPPPAPSLPLGDYLDALLTVREKLSALNLLLLECTADPVMMGMGSDSASLRRAKNEMAFVSYNGGSKKVSSGGRTGNEDDEGMEEHKALSSHQLLSDDHHNLLDEERLRSDSEIKEFFDEQISQVLVSYLSDYFDKEMSYLRQQYVSYLRKLVDDVNFVFAGTVLVNPYLKAEKMKSVAVVMKTIGSRNFMRSMLAITTDAICRMESIGRDDERRLPNYVKDVFLLQLNIVVDGVYIPCLKQACNLLLKTASMIFKQYHANNNNNTGSQSSSLSMISFDILDLLVSIGHHREEELLHFQNIFTKPLSTQPNLLAIVKENRKRSFQHLSKSCKEALYAWEVGIVLYLEKTLAVVQSKFDYSPKSDPIASLLQANATMASSTGIGVRSSTALYELYNNAMTNIIGANNEDMRLSPSTACDAICKTIITVTQAIRKQEDGLQSLDLQQLFWKPFGQQFIALLISHIRKYKISLTGARQLLCDLQEYRHVVQLMNSPETLDMMICLEEISVLLVAPQQEIVKIIAEDMRHLDTQIVLSIVKCRSDFHAKSQSDYYSRVLSATYSNFKWDAPLPWEGKKPLTVMAFNEAFQLILSNNNGAQTDEKNHKHNAYVRVLGPRTLRKASSMLPLSSLYMQEIMQQQATTHDQMRAGLGSAIRLSTTGAMSIDLAALEQNKGYNPYDLDRHARHLSTGGADNGANQSMLFSPGPRPVSKFLSSRPDDPTGNFSNTNQNTKTDPAHLPTNIQISRPDLIGVSGPMQTPKQGAKKRPSTISKAPGNDSSKTPMTNNTNSNSNNNTTATPSQAGGASNFGNAFGSAVSFLQHGSTSFMSPPPSNSRPADNKATSNTGGGMLNSFSSFFGKG